MSNYLLMWTLGPVQPFIVAARKTQDLWIGSFLLSSLMEAAFQAVQGHGREVIYPHTTTIEPSCRIADLPNTFVAKCESAEAARAIAVDAQQRVYARWNEIARQVWTNVIRSVPAMTVAQEQWVAQTDPQTIFDVYWVAKKLDAASYGATFKQLRTALNDRKRLRDFQQLEQHGEKSTITGDQAALQKPGSTRNEVVALWEQAAQAYGYKFFRAGQSERLSAIDAIKRLAASGDDDSLCQRYELDFNRFPSTSTIAAVPFFMATLQRWNDGIDQGIERWLAALCHPLIRAMADQTNPDALPVFEQYLQEHGIHDRRKRLLHQDGDTLFAATYTQKRLERDFGVHNWSGAHDDQCKQAIDQLDALIRLVRGDENQRGSTRTSLSSEQQQAIEQWCMDQTHDLKKFLGLIRAVDRDPPPAPPTPYFAVLMMDGDQMGDTIGKVPSEEAHQAISAALSTFARTHAPPIVQDQHPARLVYAGGDDVLALAPMAHVLPIADTLRVQFAQTLAAAGCPDKHASVGICIAHHQDPLSRTLRAARAAEEAAKDRYHRDSLVITLLRRSGEQTSVGAPWQYGTQATVDLLTSFFELFQRGWLSPKFAHLLTAEAPTLAILPSGAQQAEVKRLLLRQSDSRLLPEACAQPLAAELIALSQGIETHLEPKLKERRRTLDDLPTELRDPGPRRGLVEVGGWLSLLVFIVRGGRA